jgi:hypothetical protein
MCRYERLDHQLLIPPRLRPLCRELQQKVCHAVRNRFALWVAVNVGEHRHDLRRSVISSQFAKRFDARICLPLKKLTCCQLPKQAVNAWFAERER